MKKLTYTILFFTILLVGCKTKTDKKQLVAPCSDGHQMLDMPPFSSHLQKMQPFYKICFLEDGYPGKHLKNDSIYPHPLFGSYLIADFLNSYAVDSNSIFLDAAVTVADASISRMQEKEDMLLFIYPTSDQLYYSKSFYSSLTQSRYIFNLYRLYQLTNKLKYKTASEKLVKSLFLPFHEGGVYFSNDRITSIEEHPKEMPGFILNGWLTALTELKKYYSISGDSTGYDSYLKSLKSIPKILSLFDMEDYRNSRYHLAGFQQIRLLFKERQSIRLDSVLTYIPELGEYNCEKMENTSAKFYTNYIDKKSLELDTNGFIFLNAVFNRITYPKKNGIILHFSSDKPTALTLQLQAYEYLATKRLQPTNEWITDTSIHYPKGEHRDTIYFSWDKMPLLGYPTTFKFIKEKYYNVYHFMHVDRLKTINEELKNDTITKYHDKWESYISEWPKLEYYNGMENVAY